jgi:hypothetical protein
MSNLELLLIIFGGLNMLFIPFSFYMCWNKGGRFSFFKHPLSYASKTKIKSFYSFTLVSIAVFQALFITGLFIIFPATQTALALGLFYSGMVSLALSGIVTSKLNQTLHRFFTVYMITSITSWAFIFGGYFLSVSPQVGYGSILIAAVASLGVPLLYMKSKAFGLSELLFAALTVAWNVLFLCLFINVN